MNHPSRWKPGFGAAVAVGFAFVACGARTGLNFYHTQSEEPADAAVEMVEADAVHEVRLDVTLDRAREADVAREPLPDVYKNDCTDPSIQYIYVFTEKSNLYSFHPASLAFAFLGTLGCATASTPFSMAVDRKGVGYVEYDDGSLFRVSLISASCQPTPWLPRTDGFTMFGMGYSTDQGGPSEKLYVANSGFATSTSPRLGWIDTTTFRVNMVGQIPDGGMELTGTGDGRLFGFFQGSSSGSAHLVALDKTDGSYLDDTLLPGVTLGHGWAFAFWGGDFWFFTSPGANSIVTRYVPTTGEIAVVTELSSEIIVGAGVSTCAPER